MKKKLLLVCTWLLMLGVTLPVFATSTPVANDGKWYYVKSQRSAVAGDAWWTLNSTGNYVVPGAFTKANDQKFTLVTIGATTKITIKEFGGKLLTAATGSGVFDAIGAVTGWTITPNTVAGVIGTAFPGENGGLHQGSGGWNWKMSCGYYSLTDNCTFFFYEATADIDLQIAIDNAITAQSTYAVGTTPGTVSQANYDTFQAAINTAKLTLGSTDATAILNAKTTLLAAVSAFQGAVIFPFTLSSASSPVWYYIAGAGATGYSSMDKVIGVNTVSMKNYWSASVGSAAQMFRFEQVPGTATFKIVNMFYPNGGLVNTASPILCSTSSSNAWAFERLTGASGDQYRITSNGVMLHLAQSNAEVVNWTAAYNSASCLKFVAVDPTVASNAISNYLQSSIDLHQGLYNNSVVGTAPGQYLAADVAAFNTSLTAAKDVKTNLATKTPAEVLTAVSNMAAANTTLISKAIMPTSSLSSAPVWYRIKSACLASALPALSGKFMTTSSVVADTTVTLQTSTNSDYQLWRLEKQVSGSYYLVNKGTAKFVQIGRITAGNYIWFGCNGTTGLEFVVQAMGEGRFTFTKTAKKDAWDMIYAGATVGAWLDNNNYQARWAIEPIVAQSQTITFADIIAKQVGDADFSLGATTDATGVTLTYASSDEGIATVSAAGLVHITATAAGTTNITVTQSGNIFYNAATPVMKVLTVGGPNGIKSVDGQVSVTAKNRMLVITGTTEKAQAYTVTGAQVDAAKALNAGIYVVKVAGKTLKVNVQ